MADHEARIIGRRYRLSTPIGRGGMGVVWRARDELLERDVAIKDVDVRFGNAEHAALSVRRTVREARAAARLAHPGIVTVHDVIVDDGRPLIVMELVDGRSLAQVVREDGPLRPRQVAEIGLRVLVALDMAHRNGITHRDVKPANVLIDGERVVLTDFGVAGVDEASELTAPNTLVGSLEYVAPERVDGHPATPASDLWSLAVLMCAALCGKSPFHRSDPQATVAAIFTHEPDPPANAELLWPVISGLLRKDPHQRLTTPEAIERLTAILAETEPDAAALEDAPPQAKRRMSRSRSPWNRVSTVVAVALLTTGVIMWIAIRTWGTDADAGARPGPSRSSGAESSVMPTVPDGFTRYRNPAGFSLVVPDGWTKDGYEQEVFWARGAEPFPAVLVHVEWKDGSKDDELASLREFERYEYSAPQVSAYQQLRLSGNKAGYADLECTYRVTTDVTFHARDLIRTIITEEGRRFTLTLAAQDADPSATNALWRKHRPELTRILDSFHITE